MIHNDSPAFGIYRRLTPESADRIGEAVVRLQEDRRVPDGVRLDVCGKLAVVLLAEDVIANTIQQGMRVGYNLGIARARLSKNRQCQQRDAGLEIGLGDIKLSSSGMCYSTPLDPRIENEVDAIETAVGIGRYGTARRLGGRSACMNLFEVASEVPLQHRERQSLLVAARENFAQTMITTEEWHSTPFDIFANPDD